LAGLTLMLGTFDIIKILKIKLYNLIVY